MKLYHGTTSRHLDSIMREGLKPRGETDSNWRAQSNAEHVYLTNAYALHFAGNAVKEDEDLLIVEIDTDLLDEDNLLADEDAIAWLFNRGHIDLPNAEHLRGLDMHEQAIEISKLLIYVKFHYGLDAESSLKLMGTCSYFGIIQPEAISNITRYKAGGWYITFHDPAVSPMNYRFMAADYKASQIILAGHLDDALKLGAEVHGGAERLEGIHKLCQENRIDFDFLTAKQNLHVFGPK